MQETSGKSKKMQEQPIERKLRKEIKDAMDKFEERFDTVDLISKLGDASELLFSDTKNAVDKITDIIDDDIALLLHYTKNDMRKAYFALFDTYPGPMGVPLVPQLFAYACKYGKSATIITQLRLQCAIWCWEAGDNYMSLKTPDVLIMLENNTELPELEKTVAIYYMKKWCHVPYSSSYEDHPLSCFAKEDESYEDNVDMYNSCRDVVLAAMHEDIIY
jgi:hypothetical protein